MADARHRDPPVGLPDDLESDARERVCSGATVISIRQVCDELGTTLRALRFYEGRGLVTPRRQNIHRFYSPNDVEHLRTILRLKSFGLSLREIRELLQAPGEGPYGLTADLCETLIKRLNAHKAIVDTAIAELQILSLSVASRALEGPDGEGGA